ncbi:unnamed protein product [Spirodela intermedia]|uniref:Uncharacterized protein n=1 Tax=Spirodela intermedia TaxID=51605 RepID=A0A7I8IS91_SPIIN|nr:unnamed protein product [Spirodela intermedia]CAA6659833.1 unnamed protein product [Spirodela intermedia]
MCYGHLSVMIIRTEMSRARAAWTDRGTCTSLPFHVTGGQPAVGQGVVVHTREGTYPWF